MKSAVILLMVAVIGCDDTPAEPSVAGISLRPDAVTMFVGEVRAFTAAVTDRDGSAIPIAKVVYASSDTSVVMVDSTGAAVGRVAGTALVTAKSGSKSAHATVTVRNNVAGWTKTARQCGIFDAQVYCWEMISLPSTVAPPVKVNVPVPVADITAGISHYCAVDTSGGLWCWGQNIFGQLGTGRFDDERIPVRVLPDLKVAAVAAAPHHTCAVTTSRALWCWGSNATGQLGQPTTETCGIFGIPCSRYPLPISFPDGVVKVAGGGRIGTGDRTEGLGHTCAVTRTGAAYCWGAGSFGQLGNGTKFSSSTPTRVTGQSRYSAIAAGMYHTCAVADSGRIECWGLNSDGQIGRDPLPPDTAFSCTTGDIGWPCATRPVQINSEDRFRDIVAGHLTSCGLTAYSDAFCWGEGRFGQLGDGTFYIDAPYGSFGPVRVRGNLKFVTLDSHGALTCGVTPDGKAYCWGNGVAFPKQMPNP